MLRIDIPQSKLAEAEVALGGFFDEIYLDYENNDEDEVINEYWYHIHEDGSSNEIDEKYPQIRWDCVLNEHEKWSSWEAAIQHNLPELEKKGLFRFYIADITGIYIDDYTPPKSEPFCYQELIDMYYSFENGEDISGDVARYVEEYKEDSYIISQI